VNSTSEWERETNRLIEMAEDEQRKAEQRVLAAQHSLAAARQKAEALRTARDYWRRDHGLPPVDLVAEGAEALTGYHGISSKEMVAHWADQHNGEVVMNEMCTALTAAGLFQDKEQAAGTLHSAVGRMPEFEKIGRGIFRRRAEHEQSPDRPATLTLREQVIADSMETELGRPDRIADVFARGPSAEISAASAHAQPVVGALRRSY
jgi:hypothetical protein